MLENTQRRQFRPTRKASSGWRFICPLAICFLLLAWPALAAPRLGELIADVPPESLVPGADHFGEVVGNPPYVEAYAGGERVGYAFLNTDIVGAIGYSGKPIHILIGLDMAGVVSGALLTEHHEPIVLIGIPEQRMTDFIARYVGRSAAAISKEGTSGERLVEGISGATVTVMVIDDSITNAAVKMARVLGLAGFEPVVATAPHPGTINRVIDTNPRAPIDWFTLVGDGSVRRLRLSIDDVNKAFARAGNEHAAQRPEKGDPDETFIDLYVSLASVPAIGRSLLGDAEHRLLSERLAQDQHAIVVAGIGRYSFKGSGYVRGGIFDRIQLIQGDNSVRFRDRDHKRLGAIEAELAPDLDEIALFVLPENVAFDPTRPWRLELLAQRAVSALDKAFMTFDVTYRLPDTHLLPAPAPTPVAAMTAMSEPGTTTAAETASAEPLWMRIWRAKIVDVGILSVAVSLLTVIFFFQDWLARRPVLFGRVRIAFLLFALFWLGWYANAQLSVVNVLTFTSALMSEFHWEYFLMDPLVFVLWSAIAASLLFWGRGPFCGWLCPFGALQELTNKLAKLARVPQVAVPWGLHERLWPVKYMLFLGLFGISIYSLALGEQLAEIEPFKTAIILKFLREWPFVIYAVLLIVIGLFVERAFCRYLCPLGAALAIPGRLRMFEWLKRHRDCGAPCRTCANECMVQSIHPNGVINPNECLYCMHCQTLYHDEFICPPMIKRRVRRQRRLGTPQPDSVRGRKVTPLNPKRLPGAA